MSRSGASKRNAGVLRYAHNDNVTNNYGPKGPDSLGMAGSGEDFG
jgi:hypothetical protein